MATPDVLLDPCRRKSKRSPVTVGEGEIVCVTVKPVGGPAELCCGLLRFDEVVLRVCALPLKLLDASAKLSVYDLDHHLQVTRFAETHAVIADIAERANRPEGSP